MNYCTVSTVSSELKTEWIRTPLITLFFEISPKTDYWRRSLIKGATYG